MPEGWADVAAGHAPPGRAIGRRVYSGGVRGAQAGSKMLCNMPEIGVECCTTRAKFGKMLYNINPFGGESCTTSRFLGVNLVQHWGAMFTEDGSGAMKRRWPARWPAMTQG